MYSTASGNGNKAFKQGGNGGGRPGGKRNYNNGKKGQNSGQNNANGNHQSAQGNGNRRP